MKIGKWNLRKLKIDRRHWILMGLVVALCITGIVNHQLNSLTGDTQPVGLQGEDNQTDETTGNFFTDYRATRTKNRENEIKFLNEIIANEKSDAEQIKEATEQKILLTKAIEQEMLLENLIKAKGFKDCIVTINAGSINVVVDNTEPITAAQTAQILEIVRTETKESAENVKILPRT